MKHVVQSMLILILSSSAFAAQTSRAVIIPAKIVGYAPEFEALQKEIDLSLARRLARVHYAVIPRVQLRGTELLCAGDKCLTEVATRLNVDLIVTSQQTYDESLSGFRLLVEARLKDGTPAYRSRESKCENCSDADARNGLEKLLGEVIAPNFSTQKPEPNIEPVLSNVAVQPSTLPSTINHIAWMAVGIVGSVLVVAGAVGLAVAIPLNNQSSCDAKFSPDLRCPERQNTTPAIAVSAASLGLGAILAPLGFVMAKKRPVNVSTIGPFAGGLGLSLGGSF